MVMMARKRYFCSIGFVSRLWANLWGNRGRFNGAPENRLATWLNFGNRKQFSQTIFFVPKSGLCYQQYLLLIQFVIISLLRLHLIASASGYRFEGRLTSVQVLCKCVFTHTCIKSGLLNLSIPVSVGILQRESFNANPSYHENTPPFSNWMRLSLKVSSLNLLLMYELEIKHWGKPTCLKLGFTPSIFILSIQKER